MRLAPVPALAGTRPYAVPRAGAPIDLSLDGNEGPAPDPTLLDVLRDPELLRCYPDQGPLERALAARVGVAPERLLVTAGGDDTLDRVCRAMLGPGDEILVHAPGFEMLRRYARVAGGVPVEIPWPDGPFPVDAALAAVTPRTRILVVTSPNNPTGGVAAAADLGRLAEALPEVLLLVDLAYVEFADEDLTAAALALPNAVVVRSLSKAWGLAGLRVGYALGHPEVIGWLRAAGAPYAVSAPALAIAQAALEVGPPAGYIARVRAERGALAEQLAALGAAPVPSQGNFVFAEVPDPLWLRDAMAGLGIGVRAFPGKPGLERAVRVSCPGDPAAFDRLTHALGAALAPEAVLFDMDGVLADVRGSYRAAIRETAAAFGVTVTDADIQAVKALGDANNDWVVTRRLLAAAGVDAPLAQVTEVFEDLYQTRLYKAETLLVDRAWLEALGARLPLGVVTGRPRRDAVRFLDDMGITEAFSALVCMEDAPLKPDPAPVRLALETLGVQRAWLLGDTPDDVRAARAAGVVPLGVCPPGEDNAASLIAAGAARAIPNARLLEELL
ncbi:MAG: aminotransferase class I/II-fold pyridoxal phosphate-dependent enzyme [Alphaproteobacteria bacterium]|nr:aminotransferase class I/II-fold pyridoxal phosphate-dependent enzyme [Alphaproteobacteria bacterium]